NAVFPSFTSRCSLNELESLIRIYHRSSRAVALIVSPVAAFFIFFSQDILLLWTRSELVASQAAKVAPFLLIGSLMNVIGGIPYALSLAAELPWIAVYANTISVAIVLPATYLGVR